MIDLKVDVATRAVSAPGVKAGFSTDHFGRNGLGFAADRELAGDLISIVTGPFDPRTLVRS